MLQEARLAFVLASRWESCEFSTLMSKARYTAVYGLRKHWAGADYMISSVRNSICNWIGFYLSNLSKTMIDVRSAIHELELLTSHDPVELMQSNLSLTFLSRPFHRDWGNPFSKICGQHVWKLKIEKKWIQRDFAITRSTKGLLRGCLLGGTFKCYDCLKIWGGFIYC